MYLSKELRKTVRDSHYNRICHAKPESLLAEFLITLCSTALDRQTVFFTERDRQLYLQILAEQSRQAHVRVLAYCLMTNHIHLILVPKEGRLACPLRAACSRVVTRSS